MGMDKGPYRRAVDAEVSQPLTAYMLSLLEDITTPGKSDASWLRYLKLCLRTNWVSMATSLITFFLEITAAFVPGSVPPEQVPVHVSLFVGVYSCLFSQLCFLLRLDLVKKCLVLTASATTRMEGHVDAESQEALSRAVQRAPYIRFCYIMVGAFTEVLVVFSLFNTPPRWGESTACLWLHQAVLVMETYATSCCLNSAYIIIPLVINVNLACASMHDALGRDLETGPATPACAAVQSTLLRACVVIDQAMRDLWPHIMFAVVAVSLISTVEVVSSGSLQDIYAVGTAPLILTIFVPVCMVGERIGGARHEVATRAARGPWLEERPAARRLRLGIMMAAGGSGGQLGASGIGSLDKPACFAALKSWFSFVQMLLNLKSR